MDDKYGNIGRQLFNIAISARKVVIPKQETLDSSQAAAKKEVDELTDEQVLLILKLLEIDSDKGPD